MKRLLIPVEQLSRKIALPFFRDKSARTKSSYDRIWEFSCLSLAAKSHQSCPTLWPHRRQPTRLPHPWDSPGKNIGVGCHFLLQCMKVKRESEVAQSHRTLRDPMDCSPPGSSVHGRFQARELEWVASAFSLRSHKMKRLMVWSTFVML